MKSPKQFTPKQTVQADQIGEVLERTARSTATSDVDRAMAARWWADHISRLRQQFSQSER